jgi:hypothetical protein
MNTHHLHSRLVPMLSPLAFVLAFGVLQADDRGPRGNGPRKLHFVQADQSGSDDAAVAAGDAEVDGFRGSWPRKLDIVRSEAADETVSVADGEGGNRFRLGQTVPENYPTPDAPIDTGVYAVPPPAGACCFLTGMGDFDCVDVITETQCLQEFAGSFAKAVHCYEACCSDKECVDGGLCTVATCVDGLCEYEDAAACCRDAADCPEGVRQWGVSIRRPRLQ